MGPEIACELEEKSEVYCIAHLLFAQSLGSWKG